MGIPFTQYLRPDGRKQSVSIERPADIETRAQAIIDAGYSFECEELNTNPPRVSFTVASPREDEGDIAIKICVNGPDVPKTVDLLVREVYLKINGYRGTKGARDWRNEKKGKK